MSINAELLKKLLIALELQGDLDASLPQRKERTYLKGLVVDDKEDSKLRYAALTERTFAKAGYKNNVAHQTILTAKKWYAKGYMIRKGETAVKVRGLPLYHQDQVVLMSEAQRKPEPVAENVVAAFLAAQAAKASAEPTAEQIEAYLKQKAEAAAKQQAEAEAAYGSSY